MSERTPTPEQRAAIEADERSVLVEAGAGTGKTGVMVDRYCRLVCEQRVSPDAVLAFTFTDKAAAELRQRIRAAIEARAAAGSERARELLPSLGSAWLMTIHGFCNRLLGGHPIAAGIDPRFRVLDATETERAAGEAFDRALEDFLSKDDPEREALLAAYDIAGLRAIVTGVHAELRSRGVAEPRLPQPTPGDPSAALAAARLAAEEALAELKPESSLRELPERLLATLGDCEQADLETVAGLCTRSRAKPLAGYREATEELLSRTAEAGEGGRAYAQLAVLLELFSKRFAATKERRAGIDFEDLQILAVRVLERSEAGASYASRFSHLLVDEFQDTNRLQLRLIEALCGPTTQLMVVGDELQSIYGFRHADLEVFREQRAAIEARGKGGVLALSGNFRSRPEVIGAVNAIGSKLLGESFRPLRVGAPPRRAAPPGNGTAVELLLTGRDGWTEDGIDLDPATDARTPANSLAEARFLAARLRELAEAGVERGEMVVLLRAFTHLDAYEDSLERAGLRPYVVGGRGYWSQQQVADVCSLLAAVANPLDDQALFGALASPACGVSPDTLWLLRGARGRGHSVWPAVEWLAGDREKEPRMAEAQLLEAIPADQRARLTAFASRLAALRAQAPLLPLSGLIEAAVTATGYDLAILLRPAGEARLANVRKLMRLADEFEAAEGRDLRGLLDFLAARADADADPQAATAVEGHDGVRIMTVHSAKGLEFDVVAVPYLSRRLLAAARMPPLAIGREAESPRVGMQLRRLGAGSINLYAYRELCEESRQREAEEELRLFHVAATRARERLILSGVVAPKPSGATVGSPVIERIAAAFELDRERNSTIAIPPAEPRPGLDASFVAAEIAVRLNLASPERAAELSEQWRGGAAAPDPGQGPAPLLERRPPPVPNLPLSYSAIAAHAEATGDAAAPAADEAGEREAAATRGIAVHAMLEWSQANGWPQPPPQLIRRFAREAEAETGSSLEANGDATELLAPFRAWIDSDLFLARVRGATRSRAEVPLLTQLGGTVLRGSIDLLVEDRDAPPLVLDYKTDRIGDADPSRWAERYETQRDLYALAVSEALGVESVEVAYVFLEQPRRPVLQTLDRGQIEAARRRLEAKVEDVRRQGLQTPGSAGTSSRAASSSSFSSLSPSPTASSSAAQ